jgi:hypothetical protein
MIRTINRLFLISILLISARLSSVTCLKRLKAVQKQRPIKIEDVSVISQNLFSSPTSRLIAHDCNGPWRRKPSMIFIDPKGGKCFRDEAEMTRQLEGEGL